MRAQRGIRAVAEPFLAERWLRRSQTSASGPRIRRPPLCGARIAPRTPTLRGRADRTPAAETRATCPPQTPLVARLRRRPPLRLRLKRRRPAPRGACGGRLRPCRSARMSPYPWGECPRIQQRRQPPRPGRLILKRRPEQGWTRPVAAPRPLCGRHPWPGAVQRRRADPTGGRGSDSETERRQAMPPSVESV